MNKPGKRIGIFGGTFNPVHYGHLIIAENARSQFGLDRVIFMPTGPTWHKNFSGEGMREHRVNMLKLSIFGNDAFSLSKMEVYSDSICYTYMSLSKIRNDHLNDELFFILGADSLFELDGWMHPEIICRQAVILAAVRVPCDEDKLAAQASLLRSKYGAKIHMIRTPSVNLSGRDIRGRAAAGESIRYMLPDAVADYIEAHSLYRNICQK